MSILDAKKKIFAVIAVLCILMLSVGCTKSEPKELVIADQFGLAYAPIEILKATTILEDSLKAHGVENVEVIFERMGNTTAIREAMLSENLDVGFMAIPPFLLGVEKGMDWKIISGVSESPVALIGEIGIESVGEINSNHRIILPQLGSVQHILLAMAADEKMGNWAAFNEQVLAMSHPDGYTAILADPENYLHFTTPPYMESELQDGRLGVVTNGEEIFGEPFTFIVSVCQERFYKDENLYKAFKEALSEAIDYIHEYPEETRVILNAAYDYPEDMIDAILNDPQMVFSTEVKGMDKFMSYMQKMDLLKSDDMVTLSWDEE